jgi:hypothetical protein
MVLLGQPYGCDGQDAAARDRLSNVGESWPEQAAQRPCADAINGKEEPVDAANHGVMIQLCSASSRAHGDS